MRDLTDRLNNARRIIDALNAERATKVADSGDDDSLARLLNEVREQTQREIDKYKHETDDAFQRTIAEMKDALEQRLREKAMLQAERDHSAVNVSSLQSQLNETHAQVEKQKHKYSIKLKEI